MPQLSYSNGTTNVPARTFWMSKDVVVQQNRGTSKADVMSQASVTHELELIDTQIYNIIQDKLNKSEAEQVYLKQKEAENLYQPIGDYALKTDIPEFDINDYLLKSELPTKVSAFVNDAEYLTKTALAGNYYTIPEITEIVSGIKADSENWLHNFYDKDQVNELLKNAKEADSELHSNYEQRISELEAINHDDYATKEEVADVKTNLSDYATKEEFNSTIENIYTKSETDSAISDYVDSAIADLNINQYETIAGAESKYQPVGEYQPKGEYLTEHQSLEDYAKKDEVNDEIDNKVQEAIADLNISSYLLKTEAEAEYQPKGEYLTEHQSLEDYMTIERAETEHSALAENLTEIDERLKIAENLCAVFETFKDWNLGYFAEDDYALENLIEHDGCYYLIADVSNCRKTDFYAHYAPNSNNSYIFEYSGYPAQNTFIKRTKKEYFDLTFNLDSKTEYIVAFAYTPVLSNTEYYIRGIKLTDDSIEHVTQAEFKVLEKRVDEIEQNGTGGSGSGNVDLSKYATIEYVDSAIADLDISVNSDNEELKLMTCDMSNPNKMVVYFQPGRYIDLEVNGTNNMEYPEGVYYSLFAAPGDSYSSQAIKVIFNDNFIPSENNYLYEFMSYPTAQNFICKKEIKPDTKEIELTVGAKYFYIESGSGDYNQCDFEYVSTHLGTVYNSLAMNINTNVSKINNEINSKTSLGIENQEYTLENNGHWFNGTYAGKYTIVKKDLDSWTGNIKFNTTTDTVVWIALYNEEDITMLSGAYWSMQASTFTDFNVSDNFVDITQAKALVVCSDRTDSDLTFELSRYDLVKNAVIKMQDELKGIDEILNQILGV